MTTRRTVQIVLVALALIAGGAAAWRYTSTRDPSKAPRGPEITSIPESGPVGTHPRLTVSGFEPGRIRIRLCRTGDAARCADLAVVRGNGTVTARPIPAALPDGGATAPVSAGVYDLRANGVVRGQFVVAPLKLGPRPAPAALTAQRLRAGKPSEVARRVGCQATFTPDGRLVVGPRLFDPATAVIIDLALAASELAWSPRGGRLAIVTDDRKEIRLAAPDGSSPSVVVREARGLISSVSWSRDDNMLAYSARSEPGVPGGPGAPQIYVLSLLDGEKRALGPGDWVSWSPASDRMVVQSGQSLMLMDAAGRRAPLTDGSKPVWSSDASLVAFLRGGASDAALWVTPPDRVAPAAPGIDGICAAAFSPDNTRLAVVAGGRLLLYPLSTKSPPRRP